MATDVEALLKSLPHKHQVFVLEYLVEFDRLKAALKAGYTARSAHGTAGRILKNPHVVTIIEAKIKAREANCEVDAARLFQEFWSIAQGKSKGSFVVITMEHRLRALENCAKYTGGFSTKVDAKVTGDITVNRTDYAAADTVIDLGEGVTAALPQGKGRSH